MGLLSGKLYGVVVEQPETWSGDTVEGWQCGLNYNADQNARLSVVGGELTVTFPAGPGGGSPPIPFVLALIANTNSSGGRFTGNAVEAGATHLEFDFYGEYEPAANLSIELRRTDYGANGTLFLTTVPVVAGSQRVSVPLTMPTFQILPALTSFFSPPYATEFQATLENITQIYIRITRSDDRRSDAPAEVYRIDNFQFAQRQAMDQTIEFPVIPDQVATNLIVLLAIADSDLPVTYAVMGPAVLDGNELQFTGAGTVAVTASQAGNQQYNAATPVTRSFSVSKALALVELSDLMQPYAGMPRAVQVSTVPAGLGVNVSYNGAPIPPALVGTYAVEAMIDEALFEGSDQGTLEIFQVIEGVVPAAEGQGVALSFRAMPGRLYELQASPDLSDANAWQAVPIVSVRGTGEIEQLADTNGHAGTMFYRLRVRD
jgi:hypothetical protein